MKVNLNDYVTVVLSQKGADILNQQEAFYNARIMKYNPKFYMKGDTYKSQLHSLMYDFGDCCYPGADSPFLNCEVNIEDV